MVAAGVATFSLSGVTATAVVFLVGLLLGVCLWRLFRQDARETRRVESGHGTVRSEAVPMGSRDAVSLAADGPSLPPTDPPVLTKEEAGSFVDSNICDASEAAATDSRDAASVAANDPSLPTHPPVPQRPDENIPVQLRGAMRCEDGRFFRFNQPGIDPQCSHQALAFTASNAWAWSTRCPNCGMRFTMWWLKKEEKAIPKAKLIKMARRQPRVTESILHRRRRLPLPTGPSGCDAVSLAACRCFFVKHKYVVPYAAHIKK